MDRRTLVKGTLLGLLGALPWPSAARSPKPFLWPSGNRGAISLTYDDGLDSQLDRAVPALDACGLHATFFVTMENIQARLPEWRMLAARGHEVADHTVHHPCDLQRFTPDAFIRQEIAPMEAWLNRAEPGRRASVFAYPCDVTIWGKVAPMPKPGATTGC